MTDDRRDTPGDGDAGNRGGGDDAHRSTTVADQGLVRDVARVGLGAFLVAAGIAHLVVPEEFLGQVPDWLPWRRPIVLVSGVVEIVLGTALAAWRSRRIPLGWAVAGLLVVVFPGNVHQAVAGTDAFGLTTDTARSTRLVAQPLFIAWALWSTGAWSTWRSRTLR